MNENVVSLGRFSNSLLRMDTILRLRWFSLAGQLIAIGLVYFVLGFELPIIPCLFLIGISAGLNIYLKLRYTSRARLPDNSAAAQLSWDTVQLSSLLYLTGGLGNPFALLLLAPIMISATTMTPRWTILLVVLTVFTTSILTKYKLPLPWKDNEIIVLPELYEIGIVIGLIFSITYIASYAFRVAKESRQLADALAATELVVEREQHLHALDGLAAAAAHELGTPLATIHLVAKELEAEISGKDERKEDIKLIRSQSDRCREILQKLTKLSSEGDEMYKHINVSQLLEEVIEPHRKFGKKINTIVEGGGVEPAGNRNPAIHYGLGNLIENAVDFAESTINVEAHWDESNLKIVISDDGPGFSSEMMSKLGEPYFSVRKKSNGTKSGETGGGLGLGFFIAKTLLERSGGTVKLENQKSPKSGAIIQIQWPRSSFEREEKNVSEVAEVG